MPRGRLTTEQRPRPRWPLALVLCLLAGLAVLAAGCETLEKRLARNQEALLRLPAEHQTLIREGRVAVGFTPDEVYLAWGAPSHKSITESVQGAMETWYYTSTQTETFYREEHFYDWELRAWRFYSRPYQRYLEYRYQEAVFSNGRLSSFTVYPAFTPYGP